MDRGDLPWYRFQHIRRRGWISIIVVIPAQALARIRRYSLAYGALEIPNTCLNPRSTRLA